MTTAGAGLAVGGAVLCAAALDEWRGAYVTRPRSESKALRREREKKIAAGHKADDREENQGPNLAL